MRLFVALDIENSLKGEIFGLQKLLSIGNQNIELRFVARGDLHLTLKFLGEVEEGLNRSEPIGQNRFQSSHNTVTEISKRIKSVSDKTKKFNISIQGLSFFGSAEKPTVIFLDVVEGRGELIELGMELNEKLNYIRKEEFDPRPHLTLTRVGLVKDSRKLMEKINSLKGFSAGQMESREIKLFKSTLTGRGPVYTEVGRFGLNG